MRDLIFAVLKAFLVGGVICTAGQVLIDFTKLTPPKILVGFVVTGVILGGLDIYEPLLKFAGAGASIPLLGFGNLLASGVKEAVAQKGFLGIFTGGLTAASAGITTAVISGLLISIIFNPGDKN